MLENFKKVLDSKKKKAAAAALAGAVAFGGATEYEQRKVNKINQEMNHAFTIDELPLEVKIRELVGTNTYSGEYSKWLSSKIPGMAPLLRTEAKVGLIHLDKTEMTSIESAKSYVKRLRTENKKPFLVSADIEGGLINQLRLTRDDLIKFKLPAKIFEERQKEYDFYLKKYNGDKSKVKPIETYPLPSQEWLGRVYVKLPSKDKQFFKEIMEGYGRTIASISEYIGINLVFGPNLDIVDDIDGDKPDEKNDRSYGEDPNIVNDLGLAYMKGFRENTHVIPVAKHFVGNGYSKSDPHAESSKVSVPRRSGAVIPYRNAVREIPKVGVMTSVVANQIYGQPNIPTAYSTGALRSLKEDMGKSPDLVITDDLKMASSSNFIEAMTKKRLAAGESPDKDALSIYSALASGNEIALVKYVGGREDEIAKKISEYIKNKVNILGVPEGGLDERKINQLFKKVMELKVKVGLLSKGTLNGKDVYILDPKIYNPKVSEVITNSFFSNQWPWTSRSGTPEKTQPSIFGQFYKAAYNFSLSLWRVNFPTINPKYEGSNNSQKLVVVDKSIKKMWIYDKETSKLEKEYSVAIGRGGLNDRRFVGDHVTPEGVYEVVQKRDNEFWKKNKGGDLPKEYGGIEGGMLVLAGQWHPEIAIHGTDVPENTGEVSNGCVRVPNGDIQKLLYEVPVGSMVIITK